MKTVVILGLAILAGITTARGAVSIDTVRVGDPGNAADSTGYGAVSYAYNIGKYEVTAGQYTEFLNAVATTDKYGLYNAGMWNSTYGCKIQRSGSSGSYTYSVASAYANRPVNYVSWGDAARFANWLHNGQPTGLQVSSTTEDGAYSLNGATTYEALLAVSRNRNAKWAITSENEWYKAAYYKGGSKDAGYWDYPTSSDSAPGRDMTDPYGNNVNYFTGHSSYPIDSGTYYTTVAGEFQNSASPYGTFDQGGNLWEWTESINGEFSRRTRGGSFNSGTINLDGAHWGEYLVDGQVYYVGFRVVAPVPEPLTMTAVGMSIAGLAGYIRRRIKAREVTSSNNNGVSVSS